jgi:hypothetical protein
MYTDVSGSPGASIPPRPVAEDRIRHPLSLGVNIHCATHLPVINTLSELSHRRSSKLPVEMRLCSRKYTSTCTTCRCLAHVDSRANRLQGWKRGLFRRPTSTITELRLVISKISPGFDVDCPLTNRPHTTRLQRLEMVHVCRHAYVDWTRRPCYECQPFRDQVAFFKAVGLAFSNICQISEAPNHWDHLTPITD